MCKYKSAIIKYDPATDSISIHHYPDVNSHAEIMDRAGIPDDIDDQRDYVARVEKIALDKMTLIDERVRPTWLTDGLMAIIDGEMYRIMMGEIMDMAIAEDTRMARGLTVSKEYAARRAVSAGVYRSSEYRAPRGWTKDLIWDKLDLQAQANKLITVTRTCSPVTYYYHPPTRRVTPKNIGIIRWSRSISPVINY